MKKKLAIIGAGEAAKPYLDRAREKNVYTICFGEGTNSLYRDLCDEFVDVSIFDLEQIVRNCREKYVDGIVPSSEITTLIAAQAAEALGLPGNRTVNGFAGRNKYAMRQKAAALTSVRQPRYALYDRMAEYSLPAVVKSVDSCGKRGISLAKTPAEWYAAVEYAQQFSSSGEILIEEYIDGGQEYSVECVSYAGKHQVVQITEKYSSGPPHFIELGHHQPADLTSTLREKICRGASDILDALELSVGLAHIEIKVKDDEIYFIEVGARAAGGRIADTLIGLSTDFDYFGAAIDIALDTYTPVEANDICSAGIYFLCKQTAHLLPLFEAAKTAEWCVEYCLKNTDLKEVVIKSDDVLSGYLIYTADHKITAEDAV